MNSSLLSALAKAGLADKNDVLASQSEEAHTLRNKLDKFKPASFKELAGCTMSFYDRVAWIVESLEVEQSDERMNEALSFVKSRMWNGDAGKKFHGQLLELQAGTIDIPQLKAKWPSIWKP
jgi:hypothetical protein